MRYVNLGRTGLKVSTICLGTMCFLKADADEAEGTRVIHAAIDAGVNFIDTADCYGESELIVGKALADRRDKAVLATKCWAPWSKWPNEGGSSRYHIMAACERSLKRLQTDHIDLLMIHRPDWQWPQTPTEEMLGAFTDLVRQGKVRYIGSSCYPAWKLVEAQLTSQVHHLERFCCEQLNYSITNRLPENDILHLCEKYGVGVTVYSPLQEGWLTGKYRRGAEPPADSRMARKWRIRANDPNAEKYFDIVEKLAPLAEKLAVPMSQLALAWLLQNPLVHSVIVGPRTLDQFQDNLKSLDVQLDAETLAAIDQIHPPGASVYAEYPPIRSWRK
ncbi:MAG: aldo/keto reductase [Planctomycetaceae bacterium]|nr:aldo/keto reductase [Planctomycetaceae bacterium]